MLGPVFYAKGNVNNVKKTIYKGVSDERDHVTVRI